MAKGQPVHIEGALGQDQWTDDEGKPHSRIVIEAAKIEEREVKRERVGRTSGIRCGAIAHVFTPRRGVLWQKQDPFVRLARH